MAVVYSLVCWGGLTGKTLTVVPASNSFTLTNHGNIDGSKRWFDPTGNIPNGFSFGVPYCTKSVSANSFQLYSDPELTNLVTFTNTLPSVRLKSDFIVDPSHLTAYGVDISRYGTRIYDGFNTARIGSISGLNTDDEIVEFGEAFNDISTQQIIGTLGLSVTFTTSINGKRTPAFHYGVIGSGYTFESTGVSVFYTTQENITIDGFDFRRNSASGSVSNTICSVIYPRNILCNCILQNLNTTGWCHGLYVSLGEAFNNLVIGVSPGRTDVGGLAVNGGGVVYNNTITKCGTGIISYTNSSGYAIVYNNLIVGNDVNFGRTTVFNSSRFDGNIGELRDIIPVVATPASTSLTLDTAFPFQPNTQVFLSTTGTLPAVGGTPLRTDRSYFVRAITGNVITLSLVYNGAAMTFSDAGTGVHSIHTVWATTNPPANHIDFSDPSLVFKDWANNDCRPAGTGAIPASQAKMVDTSISKRNAVPTTDIAGLPRPSYNNGGPEGIDVGAYEFDPGFGLRPASFSLTLTNVVIGSRVIVRDELNTTTHYDQLATTSTVVIVVQIYNDSRDNWIVKVRKGTEAPYYRPWDTLVTATEDSQSIYVSQIPD